jgi:rhamnulokinase
MSSTRHLACDLGAESGRLILGHLEQGRLAMEEIHRFPNGPVKSGASLRWDIPRLFESLQTGLKKAGARGETFDSISTDSWGIDYMLFDADGRLMSPTFNYRDPRTESSMPQVRRRLGDEVIFAETGIQFLSINTLYQLAAETPDRLAAARRFLLIADGFNYLLSGEARAEVSLASTTQLYNPVTRSWSRPLLEALKLPGGVFPSIVPSGTRLGPLKSEQARESGLKNVNVIASCSHDTGAAVAAVPALDGNWAYLSSGTWSLLGVELEAPILNETCRTLNFTNEIGYGNSVRLLKNIIGLWLVQECRRLWAREGKDYDYASLSRMAAESPAFVTLVNPADPRFLAPASMPEVIAQFCRETGQPTPANEGATIRCVLESLALYYRHTVRQLETLTGHPLERLHVVGGGSQNRVLNQFTANALQIPVLAGPVEATAAGNILVQALALGKLESLPSAREVVRRSFPIETVTPREAGAWDAAYARFEPLVAG